MVVVRCWEWVGGCGGGENREMLVKEFEISVTWYEQLLADSMLIIVNSAVCYTWNSLREQIFNVLTIHIHTKVTVRG
jgi:hypothetical protein